MCFVYYLLHGDVLVPDPNYLFDDANICIDEPICLGAFKLQSVRLHLRSFWILSKIASHYTNHANRLILAALCFISKN